MKSCEKPNYIFRNHKYDKWKFLTHAKYIREGTAYPIVMEVPCGYCRTCLENKSLQVKNYLLMEKETAITSYFITLTYDNEHLKDNSTHIKDLKEFTKKIRNYYRNNYGITNLKYYGVTEYGDHTLRPHAHIVFFNLPLRFNQFIKATKTPKKDHSADIDNKWINENYFTNRKIKSIWKKGNITISGLDETRINYIVAYLYKSMNELTKEKKQEMKQMKLEIPQAIHSINLGKETIEKNIKEFKDNNLIYCNGKTIHANKYIDTKAGIYTEERANTRLFKRLEKIGTHKKSNRINNIKGTL